MTTHQTASKQWTMRREQNSAKAEILIYEDIGDGMFGGLSAKSFVDQLTALGDVTEIDVRINSWGGIGAEGIAMYNALERHPATVNVYVDAMAASAASIVAMAASPGKLVIAPNARLMVHRAWNIAVGNTHEMQATAEQLDQLDNQIAAMYAKRTGRRAATMLAIMDAETYYTGEEAVAEGFADKVANEPSAMNAPRRGKELAWLTVPAELQVPEDLKKGADPTKSDEIDDQQERLATAVAVRMRKLELDLIG